MGYMAVMSSKKKAAARKRRRFLRKKICRFCADKLTLIDYKDVRRLRNLVIERGKIIPRRISGNCAGHQRQLTVAIKRARHLALMPFTVEWPLGAVHGTGAPQELDHESSRRQFRGTLPGASVVCLDAVASLCPYWRGASDRSCTISIDRTGGE